MKLGKHFRFTVNNPTDEPEKWIDTFFENEKPNYVIIGEEVAPTTGTPHYQGYCQFPKRRRFAAMSTKYNCTFLGADATDEANFKYCSKEGKTHERGERVSISHGGKRTSGPSIQESCIDIKDSFIAKKSRMDILSEYPHLSKHVDSLQQFRPDRTTAPKVLYIWGTTGHGKTTNTRRAIEKLGLSSYWKPSSNKWWPGYDNQEVVILEEFSSCFNCSTFLQLCDQTPTKVEFKGGFAQFDSPYIIILSNVAPEDQYPKVKEDIPTRHEAYLRRVTNSFCTNSVGRCDVKSDVREVIFDTVLEFLDPSPAVE